MPIPQNKEELLSAIKQDYAKLKSDLHKVSSEMMLAKNMTGHAKDTMMSPYDLVAYLTGWAELVLLWHDQYEKGEEIIFPCAGFNWNELGRLAQKFYVSYPTYDFHGLVDLFDQKVSKIIAIIKDTDDKVLYGAPWYKAYTMGRMIQLNTSSPYKNARKRIRKLMNG